MTEAPAGNDFSTPMEMPVNIKPKVGLPGATNSEGIPSHSESPPEMVPKTTNTYVPAFWADANRIISDVFKLFETDPEAAQALWASIKHKLARPKNVSTSGSSGSAGTSGK